MLQAIIPVHYIEFSQHAIETYDAAGRFRQQTVKYSIVTEVVINQIFLKIK
jgi:hypothetical protein